MRALKTYRPVLPVSVIYQAVFAAAGELTIRLLTSKDLALDFVVNSADVLTQALLFNSLVRALRAQ